jgi:hypothetical protein
MPATGNTGAMTSETTDMNFTSILIAVAEVSLNIPPTA